MIRKLLDIHFCLINHWSAPVYPLSLHLGPVTLFLVALLEPSQYKLTSMDPEETQHRNTCTTVSLKMEEQETV